MTMQYGTYDACAWEHVRPMDARLTSVNERHARLQRLTSGHHCLSLRLRSQTRNRSTPLVSAERPGRYIAKDTAARLGCSGPAHRTYRVEDKNLCLCLAKVESHGPTANSATSQEVLTI
jgi:hypothetical protein